MATATTTKTAAKKATKKTAAKKATKAPAKKAPAKKTSAKTATAKRATREIPAKRLGAAANGSFKRLADSASSFSTQVGKTAGAVAHSASESASHLADAARTKAQAGVSKTRKFLQEHPGEAAALATAGLTVAAAVLGRKRVGGLAKAAAAAGLASKANVIGKKASELATKLKKHIKS